MRRVHVLLVAFGLTIVLAVGMLLLVHDGGADEGAATRSMQRGEFGSDESVLAGIARDAGGIQAGFHGVQDNRRRG